MNEDEMKEALELERRIKAEAEKCAKAIKLLGAGELRFTPEGMDSSTLLACFLLELEAQCAKIGASARIGFCLYPCESEKPPQAAAANDADSPRAVH